ncbi:MAG: FTR1 family protein [Alphaproteobacteria bacterium]|uniref:FTR1 family iron permease n=1 Tax=Aestuariivirga sp. TaxID=2650926 RepID=UPI0030170D53|nr:FTR1 family protein [Alphaproteobacteria bacterium]
MLWQTAVIIWRELVEALLVIGILHAWLVHEAGETGRSRGTLYLWGGVVAGVAAAVALGAVLVFAENLFGEDGQDYFQAAMVLAAAVLIVQMVVWMRRHGRTLKKEITSGLTEASQGEHWWGVFTLALIAVAREGSETAVFLYGSLAGASGATFWGTAFTAALGFAAALATYFLLQLGSRIFSWRHFFVFTEIMLLLLAFSLLLTGIDRLAGLGLLPLSTRPLWDSSALLSDTSPAGNLIAALTGYRAKPDISQLIAAVLYWSAIAYLLRGGRSLQAARAA